MRRNPSLRECNLICVQEGKAEVIANEEGGQSNLRGFQKSID